MAGVHLIIIIIITIININIVVISQGGPTVANYLKLSLLLKLWNEAEIAADLLEKIIKIKQNLSFPSSVLKFTPKIR